MQIRHKLFYTLLALSLICGVIFLRQAWFLSGWIKYCESAQLKLSNFNSIFELCATFSLAYTVIIKFRHGVKNRLYSSVQKRLEDAKTKAQLILITSPNARHDKDLAEYISDIVNDRDADGTDVENPVHPQGEGSFLYFGFYSLVCLVISGLIDSMQNPKFWLEAHTFLFLFTFSSFLVVEINYFLLRTRHFEVTALIFLINLMLCFSFARHADKDLLLSVFSNMGFPTQGISAEIAVKVAVNYCVLLCIFINAYPYFQIFRALYFVSLQYSCTSFQISMVVETKIRVKKVMVKTGRKLLDLGNGW